MSVLFGATHRQLQDEHGTRKLADRLEANAHAAFEPQERAFIEGVASFFLSTVDAHGQPTVSYKGGAPGFVRVRGPSELAFPNYDGNGMFMTLGNIAASERVGLLFIDFERPHRLRVHGTARLSRDAALLALYPGADCVVEVTATQIFVNCGRYIHRSAGATLSPHVPDQNGRQPFPAWKRLDLFEGALPEADARRVARVGGTIPLDEYPGEADPAPSLLPDR
ncbi:pyridoxamine 5'-phosphate oxidase family protein [Methylobacterium terricola]|uniref:Pyridoxamine 5'-phosphate oxidase family protein n=1 Tax=Methylobacterium terricola TaxID=2583531 RepID=A0A5C4LL07_9HYPH|nr:pyridoxamine 5'-phosphate oxidase family protein [Methylobacterium terricola]TNC13729.1 pyridoxamine 5'-phosphate oxidase family protein [Methylobacterium terricola]